MAGLLGSLHAAKSGMNVSQNSIQTTSHNINNMNTPGYSRQRVEQSAKSAYSYPGYNSSMGAGQLGTGVQANDVIRIRNTFYDFQFRSESHNYGDTRVKYDYYKNMESIFNEPSDTSISSSLNKFFNAWHELSKDPNSVGAKNVVVENAKYLANNITQVHGKLDNLQTSLDKQQGDMINDINRMISDLQELNKHIKIVEGSGKTPNDLLDQRDRILDDLSFKMDINNPDIKDAIESGKKFEVDSTTGNINIINDDKSVAKSLSADEISGELSSTITMNEELDKYKKQLGELSQGIANSVNKIYNNGISMDKDGFLVNDKGDFVDAEGNLVNEADKVEGKKLYEVEVDDEGNFVSMKINKDIEKDPAKLEMTADIALKMYNLKNEKITFGEAPNEKTMTINSFYNNIVQELGQASQTVIREEKNQSKILMDIDNSRLSVSGVSMDEEMINLIQFQHAYNASAKVISTIDSLLDVVVNGLVR